MTTPALRTVQGGKADSVTGIVRWGPVHVYREPWRLTWCGKRMRGIRVRHALAATTKQIPDPACPTCVRAVTTGKPKPKRSRR